MYRFNYNTRCSAIIRFLQLMELFDWLNMNAKMLELYNNILEIWRNWNIIILPVIKNACIKSDYLLKILINLNWITYVVYIKKNNVIYREISISPFFKYKEECFINGCGKNIYYKNTLSLTQTLKCKHIFGN